MKKVLLRHPVLAIPGTKWFQALPGFDGIEHSFEGKLYKFFENKAVEAPASFIMHEHTIYEVEAPKAEPRVEIKTKKEEVKDADNRF